MGKFITSAALIIGLALIAGERLFADHIVMWFASPDAVINNWRMIIAGGLLAVLFVQEFYDSVYWRLAWGIAAAVMFGSGFEFFLNNGQYVFDALFLVMSAIGLAIAALQPAAEPLDKPAGLAYAQQRMTDLGRSARQLVRQGAGQLRLRPLDRLASWRYISDISAHKHRINMRPPISRGV